MLIRSPAVSSMSSSRPGGSGVTCWARSSSSSVVSPIADTATTTSWPSRRVATIRSATRLIRSASATEEPPYFCTTSPTTSSTPCDGSGLWRVHTTGRRRRYRGKGMPMTQPDTAEPAAGGGIRARGIRRSFGPVQAVQGIDLDAPPGQVTALVGPNGAGKTTALLVLATLLTPDAGEVRVAGFDPVTQAGVVRARMGWSPDVFGLYDTLTCREYLEVMAAAYRLPRAERAGRADTLLALARLPYPDAPVHTLSRGQKQRLGLVRALVHDPLVLLLDEPASGLDPRSRVELRDLLRRLAGEGRTVLVSSHILSDLEEVADRVVFVDHGRTVGQHAIGDLPAARSVRTYRLRALDPQALQQALERIGVGWTGAGHAGVDVQVLGGEPSAARLLGELVAADVAITAFAPLGGSLEATYLDLVEEQR